MRVVTTYPLLERKHFIFFSFLLFLHFSSVSVTCFVRFFSFSFHSLPYSNCNSCDLLLSSFLSSSIIFIFLYFVYYTSNLIYLVYYFFLFLKFSFFPLQWAIAIAIEREFRTVMYLRAGN